MKGSSLMLTAAAVLCILGPNKCFASNVLILTPFGSRSVRSCFSTLAQGLVERGHAVTIVSSGDPVPHHANVTHVLAPHSALDQMDLFEVRESGVFQLWMKAFPMVARQMYTDPNIMDLWRRRDDFDVIIVNSAANEMAFPFLMDIKVPFVTLAPAGTEPMQLAYLGNFISPAALPSIVLQYDDKLSLWERMVNTIATVGIRYSFRRVVGRPLIAALKESFPDFQDPYSLYPNQSLSLLNRHHLLDGAIPLLPNQVEVGCMQCRPPRPLPKDVTEWLEGAGEGGVVYFSMGSFQNSSRIPQRYRDTLFQAFAALKHRRILVKFSGDGDDSLPANVRAYSWLPQQDVLGHSAVKVFITHCGKHSASESLYHGVPMLGLPIAFDQPRTCARLARRGEGLVLQWEKLTSQAIVDAVNELADSTEYRGRVQGVSRRLQAQKETGLERAVWWVEYVTSHGSDYLTFSGANLSLWQYLLLDIVAIAAVAVGVAATLVYLVTRFLLRAFWPKGFEWSATFWTSVLSLVIFYCWC